MRKPPSPSREVVAVSIPPLYSACIAHAVWIVRRRHRSRAALTLNCHSRGSLVPRTLENGRSPAWSMDARLHLGTRALSRAAASPSEEHSGDAVLSTVPRASRKWAVVRPMRSLGEQPGSAPCPAERPRPFAPVWVAPTPQADCAFPQRSPWPALPDGHAGPANSPPSPNFTYGPRRSSRERTETRYHFGGSNLFVYASR